MIFARNAIIAEIKRHSLIFATADFANAIEQREGGTSTRTRDDD